MATPTRKRDWRDADTTSPLHNLLKKSPLSTPSSSTSNFAQRNSNSSSNINGTTCSYSKDSAGKLKSVAEPATIRKIIVVLLIHVCKKVLFVNLKYKVIFYFCATLAVSIVTDHFPPPISSFSDPSSLLNSFFVRYAWTWTCAINAFFIYLTCSIYYSGDFLKINRNLTRLAISALWWYLQSYVSVWVANRYGVCLGNTAPLNDGTADKVTSETCNGRWLPFSISERTFVLLHCLLISLEEAKSLVVCDRLQELMMKKEYNVKTSDEKLKAAKEFYISNASMIKVSTMLTTLTVVFLDIEFFVSAVYFNNMPQKLVAVVFAITGWLLTYKSWFRSKPAFISSLWSPGMPGNNQFISIIDR